MRRQTLRLGSISSGTLRTEDLLPAFLETAEALRLSAEDRRKVRGIRKEWDALQDEIENGAARDTEIEAMGEDVLRDIEDILNAHCPDYCSFGAHEGDGSDFGVWPTDIEIPWHEAGNDDIGKSAELPKASDVAQWHWLTVTDHGNCTLWRKTHGGRRWTECWSLV
jgi:hypothetical protein